MIVRRGRSTLIFAMLLAKWLISHEFVSIFLLSSIVTSLSALPWGLGVAMRDMQMFLAQGRWSPKSRGMLRSKDMLSSNGPHFARRLNPHPTPTGLFNRDLVRSHESNNPPNILPLFSPIRYCRTQ